MGDVTQLLREIQTGNQEAESRLLTLIYPQLRRIANHYMSGERSGHTLQATALVHEAYLKLAGQDTDWKDRAHFYAVAARVMRQILVDYARQRRSAKRGGAAQRVDLDAVVIATAADSEKILSLDEALSRLAEWDLRQSRIVEMRFFAGLSEQEIAEALGISERTVKRDWQLARAWLYEQIGR